MNRDLINKYIWIVDTLLRYKKLSREEINDLWIKSPISNGEPLPERTFFHYRRSIEKVLNIDINCDKTGKYFIEEEKRFNNRSVTNLLFDSFVVGNAFRDISLPGDRVEIEDVPSSREFLPAVMEAISRSVKIIFTYAGFNRSRSETDIIFEPYFLKRYKQRWYMIGMKDKGKSIRTYALDRVKELRISNSSFDMPSSLNIEDLFANIIGVTTSQAPLRIVKLRVNTIQAKYFRALPLHQSQNEELHDDYSIFSYKLKLNYELVHEILSYGDSVEVIEPKELRIMVLNQLKNTLELYEKQIKK